MAMKSETNEKAKLGSVRETAWEEIKGRDNST